MSGAELSVAYGIDRVSFRIPEKFLNCPPLAPRTSEPLSGSIQQVIASALDNPVGRPPLERLVTGRQVAVVISDEFRAGLQKNILEALVGRIVPAGPHCISVLCATGTHDPAVYAKGARQWVEELSARHGTKIDFYANDSRSADFVDIGTTSRGTPVRVNRHLLDCDVRVYGHEAKHHYFHGYSCIDKQLLPGLSSDETVRANHKLALDPDSGPGRSPYHPDPGRRTNPVCEDSREARRMSELFVTSPSGKAVRGEVATFGLDMVSEGDRIYWIAAGDPETITARMVQQVDRFMAAEVERSRYVIVSPGGPPASQALYGTQNSFDLALKNAILPGGEALVVAPLDGRPDLDEQTRGLAPSARAKKLFWDNLVELVDMPYPDARRWIEQNFEMYLWKTERVLRLLKKEGIKIFLYCQLDAERLAPGGFFKAPDIQAWIDERVSRGDGKFTVIDGGNKLCVTSTG